jgi:hypothetical protein
MKQCLKKFNKTAYDLKMYRTHVRVMKILLVNVKRIKVVKIRIIFTFKTKD